MAHLLTGGRAKRQVEFVRLTRDPGALIIENNRRYGDSVLESIVFLGEPEGVDIAFDDDRDGGSFFTESKRKGEDTKKYSRYGIGTAQEVPTELGVQTVGFSDISKSILFLGYDVAFPSPHLQISILHPHLDLPEPAGRRDVGWRVAELVETAIVGSKTIESLLEVVLVDSSETACLVGQDAESVLTFPNFFGKRLAFKAN